MIMELYIETLTGMAFELRVSPFETVFAVKAKIQRMEGIPISQQHLIWQSRELEDEFCLQDYSITDGATLKLVLAMRGGPINARRLPLENHTIKEISEYVEANREEIWEKLPSNRQVTLLVFREGDQLNFFRVVDRGDGTLTPFSESLSATPILNYVDDEDEVEAYDDVEMSPEKQRENAETREKMNALRSKMECLTVNRKPKRKVRPPSSAVRPGSRDGRHRARRMSGRLKGQTRLPPVGTSYTASESSNASGEENWSELDDERRRHLGLFELDNFYRNGTYQLENGKKSVSLPSGLSGQTDPIEGQSSTESDDPEFNAGHLSGKTSGSGTRSRHGSRQHGELGESDKKSEACAQSPVFVHRSGSAATGGVKAKHKVEPCDQASSAGICYKPKIGTLSSVKIKHFSRDCDTNMSSNADDIGYSEFSEFTDNPVSTYSDSTLENSSSDEVGSTLAKSFVRNSVRSRGNVMNSGHLKLVGHPAKLDARIRLEPLGGITKKDDEHSVLPGSEKTSSLSLPPAGGAQEIKNISRTFTPGAERLSAAESDSKSSVRKKFEPCNSQTGKIRRDASCLGNAVNVKNKVSLDKRKQTSLDSLMFAATQEHDATDDIMNKASSLDTLQKSEIYTLGSLVRTSAQENLSSSKSKLVDSNNAAALLGMSSSGNHGNSGRSSPSRVPTPLLSTRLQQKLAYSRERLISPLQQLPPVKSRKRVIKRCYQCHRKTGLATSYLCRCGNNFCTMHRYAESHDCTFDYKTEGRRFIHAANPVVAAPKLPKI